MKIQIVREYWSSESFNSNICEIKVFLKKYIGNDLSSIEHRGNIYFDVDLVDGSYMCIKYPNFVRMYKHDT